MASQDKRPISPFMLGQTYRLQITSVMSLMHRLSGVLLAFAAFGFALWLMAIAMGGSYADCAYDMTSSLLGKIALFVVSLALMYHLFNGIRHLAWDAGFGFKIPQVYASGYTVLALTIISTLIRWFVAMSGGAA